MRAHARHHGDAREAGGCLVQLRAGRKANGTALRNRLGTHGKTARYDVARHLASEIAETEVQVARFKRSTLERHTF